ncbi:MAG: isoprenyl transferase [Bacillota bacterium]|nr:isoprenyl transferase [Bacillota bacterium]MDD3297304.1 isoprenyl transferase [Bacillota bacterium]MDD3850805.1 isoprenyl transferase [Bacillota bacterium]MDD4706820.1 isoprenyl transferase [Bacillota bacterium]
MDDKTEYPRHVAVIMDGNGRWARKRGLPRVQGHRAGVLALKEIVKYSRKIGLKYLTLYAFSTENWKRPELEIKNLMNLLMEYLRSELGELKSNNIKLNILGDVYQLQAVVQQELKKAVAETAHNDGMVLSVAINYGGRNEILRAVKNIAEDICTGNAGIKDIDQHFFENYLYTRGMPNPDLVIRPSGELRISNFLLWQIAYSEFWFSDCYWPDFTTEMFEKALKDYARRDRRYGGVDSVD